MMQNDVFIDVRERVYFNIRGKKYETYESTLSRFPQTLLGNKDQRKKYFNQRTGEYVLDCSTEIFDAVLFFYQSTTPRSKGILAKSSDTSEREFENYLRFFGLARPRPRNIKVKEKTFRGKLWDFLEKPHKSKISRAWAYLSFLVICVSVATICIETVVKSATAWFRTKTVWFKLEIGYILFFTLEYAARLYGAPNRKGFLISALGVIDFIAIAPFYSTLFGMIFDSDISFQSAAIIRVLRLVQILRIIKLWRYSAGLRVLGKSLQSCIDQVTSMSVFFLIGVIFSSTLIYLFEGMSGNSQFESIPYAMWYVIISMTTVGYGDPIVLTPLGKLASVISIFIGTVVLFYLFLPIYLTYFSIYYSKWQEELRSANENDGKKHLEDPVLRGARQALARQTSSFPTEREIGKGYDLIVSSRQTSRTVSRSDSGISTILPCSREASTSTYDNYLCVEVSQRTSRTSSHEIRETLFKPTNSALNNSQINFH